MNNTQKRKLMFTLFGFTIASCAVGLILFALRQNINLFYTPSGLLTAHLQENQPVRLGGYVKTHSVHYSSTGESVSFAVTDHLQHITVHYAGVLPTLFREGQGIVVTGFLNKKHQFIANQVLAKHDENYMPATLKNALSGRRA